MVFIADLIDSALKDHSEGNIARVKAEVIKLMANYPYMERKKN